MAASDHTISVMHPWFSYAGCGAAEDPIKVPWEHGLVGSSPSLPKEYGLKEPPHLSVFDLFVFGFDGCPRELSAPCDTWPTDNRRMSGGGLM